MSGNGRSGRSQAVTWRDHDYYVPCRPGLTKSRIERFWEERFDEIKDNIESLAYEVFRPSRRIYAEFSLQSVHVAIDDGRVGLATPEMVHSSGCECPAYLPTINVFLPADISSTDERINLFMGTILIDHEGASKYRPSARFQDHPVYCPLSIQLLGLSSGPLWYLTTAIYIIDPKTVLSMEPTKYVQYDTRNVRGIEEWMNEDVTAQWANSWWFRGLNTLANLLFPGTF
ncbi:hypothetical protein F4677DRAFT_449811 [Hypoxylon crocopeplum]|nr:hypothetical protein F4677DRAFT_449811 [Hypoxylon crocopeplum]